MRIALQFVLSLHIFISFAMAQTTTLPLSESLKNWKLAFVRGKDIWISNGDGSEQRLLLKNAGSPCWSSDKKRIAFIRDCNLWIANSDGTEQRALTSNWKSDDDDMCECYISWHPKEPFITFSHPEYFVVYRLDDLDRDSYRNRSSERMIAGSSIFDIQLDSENPKAIVRFDIYDGGTGFNHADHNHPAWSASGEKMAFTRNGDIWIAQKEPSDGSEEGPGLGWDVTRIAAVASYDAPTYRASRENHGATQLSWSQDEEYLAYSKTRLQGSGFAELHLLNVQNGNDRKIAEDAFGPCFSPDGQFIAYWINSHPEECAGGDSICIWITSLDGTVKQMLVSNAIEPAW